MTTERDDDVSSRYRALAREEPPASVDAAILAASRRAVGARPGRLKRWGPPLSIAALLVLASGVVLRMQAENPGVEQARPATPAETTRALAPSPAAPDEFKSEAMPEIASPESKPPRPRPRAQKQAKPAPPPGAPSPAAEPTLERAPQYNLQAAPQRGASAPAAAAAASAADDSARAEPRDLRARQKSAAPTPPEVALEAIGRLRDEGRGDEADRALERFHRDFPDYRITEAQWARVKPRDR
jgi:hypothetical protein